MKYPVTIMQMSNKSVVPSGYRYVLVMTNPGAQRTRSFAAGSMYELSANLYNEVTADEWREIEKSLAVTGAWKGEFELQTSTASYFWSTF
jgi:hypothetical protein